MQHHLLGIERRRTVRVRRAVGRVAAVPAAYNFRSVLACVSTACRPLPGAMPLAINQRVFGTSTRSSPFWMPHTNDRPPDGVHGAGGGVCAAAPNGAAISRRDRGGQDALLHRLPPLLRHCASNALRPPAPRPLGRAIESRDARPPRTRGRDARLRRLRDRPGADPRPAVAAPDRRRPDSGACSSRCRCSRMPSLRSPAGLAAPSRFVLLAGAAFAFDLGVLALRHRQHLGEQGHRAGQRHADRRHRGCVAVLPPAPGAAVPGRRGVVGRGRRHHGAREGRWAPPARTLCSAISCRSPLRCGTRCISSRSAPRGGGRARRR